MAEFDPYHKWLGIPADEQPANHYRLLGLTRFESDPDVIESAAEGRMVMLRTRQSGPHAAYSQQLLNEVAVAQRCLLDANQKAVYDEQLARQTAAAAQVPQAAPITPAAGPPQTVPPRSAPPRSPSEPIPAEPAPAAATQPAVVPGPSIAPAAATPEFTAPRVKRRRPVSRWLLNPALIGVLIAGLLLLGVIYALTRTDSSGEQTGQATASGENGAGSSDSDNSGDDESTSDPDRVGDSGDGTNSDANNGDANNETNGGAESGVGGETGSGATTTVADANSGNGSSDVEATALAAKTDIELRSTIWKVLKADRAASSLEDAVDEQPNLAYFVTKSSAVGSRTLIFEAQSPIDDAQWLRIETLADPRLPANGPGWNGDGNFVMSEVRLSTLPPGESQWQSQRLEQPSASFSQGRMSPNDTLDRKPQSGWAIYPEVGKSHQLMFRLAAPLPQGTPLRVELVFAHRGRNGYTAWLGKFRVAVSASATRPPLLTPESAAIAIQETPTQSPDSASKTEPVVRMAVPPSDEIDGARTRVREAIPPPASQTREDLIKWSQQLLAAVEASQEDPIEFYAVTSEAERAATLSCDPRLAFQAIDLAASRFEVDVLGKRLKTLTAMADRVQSPSELDALLVAGEGVAWDLFNAERYQDAGDLLDECYRAFQRRDSDWHLGMIGEMRKFARRLVRAKALSESAQTKLEAEPNDGDANATMGMWHVLYNDDFEKGLPFYRRGSDSVWKKLADAEAAPQIQPKALGDQWWDAGQRKEKETQSAMLRRAGYWYAKALPTATPLTTKQLNDRLEKIRQAPSFVASKPWTTNIAVGESLDLLPSLRTDSDPLEGDWRRSHETVAVVPQAGTNGRIRMPVKLSGDYALAVEFTAEDGGGVLLALPAGGRGFQLLLGTNGMSGIQYVSGLPTPQNRIATPARLSRGQRHSLMIRFASEGNVGRIDVRLDKRPYLVWEGDLTKLDDPTMLRGAVDGLAFGAQNGARVQFHAVRLRLDSGTAQLTHDAHPFRLPAE